MSSRFHKSMTTAVPTVMKANSPTILQEIVRDKKTPVRIIHVHQGLVNSLPNADQHESVSTSNQQLTCSAICGSGCSSRKR